MRGGVSPIPRRSSPQRTSSPRAWGCFYQVCQTRAWFLVFPTCVGVFLARRAVPCGMYGLPHVRGGVSSDLVTFFSVLRSSPRAWGCFYQRLRPRGMQRVFPTCVGVFPTNPKIKSNQRSLPHVRGGVSIHAGITESVVVSSPRAWGCFSLDVEDEYWTGVFPTCVGVFLPPQNNNGLRSGLPHVRGGVSSSPQPPPRSSPSSPRAWGCFQGTLTAGSVQRVFPTCVGVFLSSPCALAMSTGLPHVRGGVSTLSLKIQNRIESSPRAWGCFYQRLHPHDTRRGLPHVRGGVSPAPMTPPLSSQSSPRAWGCFLHPQTGMPSVGVFPTCVGVFLFDTM